MIKMEKEEIKAKPKKTNFADFMDHNPKAIAKNFEIHEEVKQSTPTKKTIGVFQNAIKQKVKRH